MAYGRCELSERIITLVKMEKLGWIDMLKGLAMLSIISVHISIAEPQTGIAVLDFLVGHGMLGTQIFFMISAFLVCRSATNNDDITSGVKKWLKKKWWRLAPLYYFFLALSLLGLLLIGEPVNFGTGFLLEKSNSIIFTGINLFNYVLHFCFLQTLLPFFSNNVIGVEWYVGNLMLYYCFSAFVLIRIKNIKYLFVILWCTIVFAGGAELLNAPQSLNNYLTQWESWSKYFAPWVNLPVWLLGYISYFVYQGKVKLRYILLTAIVVVAFRSIISIYVCFSMLLFSSFYFCNKYLKNESSFFWLGEIGKNSYFIYFIHVFFIRTYNGLLSPIMKEYFFPLTCMGIKFLLITVLSYGSALFWKYLKEKGRFFINEKISYRNSNL